jgi:hypothetical protein
MKTENPIQLVFSVFPVHFHLRRACQKIKRKHKTCNRISEQFQLGNRVSDACRCNRMRNKSNFVKIELCSGMTTYLPRYPPNIKGDPRSRGAFCIIHPYDFFIWIMNIRALLKINEIICISESMLVVPRFGFVCPMTVMNVLCSVRHFYY